MGLDEILQAMERDAAAQVEEILKAAGAEAQAVIAQAEEEAKRARDSHVASAKVRLQRERDRLLSAAKLKTQQEIRSVRNAWMDQAFDDALQHLARIREEPCYAAYLEKLTREAVAALGTEINLEVDPADEGLMNRIVTTLGIQATIVSSLATLGGLRARTSDGRLMVTNTFEARLERARDELAQKLAALLDSKEVS